MAITEVLSSTFLADAVNLIRDKLKNNIDDPLANVRPTNERFVYTSYPKRATTYPIITVVDRGISHPKRLGMGSEGTLINLTLEIRIWARNVKERDELFDKVHDYLRTNQLDDDGLVDANLDNFQMTSAINISEDGEEGIKSKIMEVRFLFVCQ